MSSKGNRVGVLMHSRLGNEGNVGPDCRARLCRGRGPGIPRERSQCDPGSGRAGSARGAMWPILRIFFRSGVQDLWFMGVGPCGWPEPSIIESFWMIFCFSSSEYNTVWACLGWFMLILSNTQTLMSWHTHGIHYVSSLWSCSETGDDPYLGSELTRAYVKGVQSQGVLGIVKHWVFNSQETRRRATDRGSRRGRCTKYGFDSICFNGIVNFSLTNQKSLIIMLWYNIKMASMLGYVRII